MGCCHYPSAVICVGEGASPQIPVAVFSVPSLFWAKQSQAQAKMMCVMWF